MSLLVEEWILVCVCVTVEFEFVAICTCLSDFKRERVFLNALSDGDLTE